MTKSLIEDNDSARIERLLGSIRPEPGRHFHNRMANMPWNTKKSTPLFLSRNQIEWGIVSLVLVLTATFILFTPIGHALANEIVQLFVRTEGDSIPGAPQLQPSPIATRTPEPIIGLALVSIETMPTPTSLPNNPPPMPFLPEDSLRMSLDEAEGQFGLDLYEPYLLPRDYLLTDIVYVVEEEKVCMFYHSPQAGSNEYFSICQGKNFQSIPVGATANISKFQIGDYSAELVKGGWYTPVGSTTSVWSNHPETYTIRWDTDDRSIEMLFMLNESFSPAYIGREEMITLAKSMISCPYTENIYCDGSHVDPIHQPYPQDVDDRIPYKKVSDVEPLAEFEILEPDLIPEGLSFSHVRFSASGKFIWLEYGAFAADLMRTSGPHLRISQGILNAQNTIDERFPPNAIELVEINGYQGTLRYGSLVTQTVSSDQMNPTPTWNPSGEIQLVWQTETMWYSIWFSPGFGGGERLSKESILRIAESLH